jgi:hypothetical protein
LTSALDGDGGEFHAPATISPGKEPPVPTGYDVCKIAKNTFHEHLCETGLQTSSLFMFVNATTAFGGGGGGTEGRGMTNAVRVQVSLRTVGLAHCYGHDIYYYCTSTLMRSHHVMSVPVTMARRDVGLRMEKTASTYEK